MVDRKFRNYILGFFKKYPNIKPAKGRLWSKENGEIRECCAYGAALLGLVDLEVDDVSDALIAKRFGRSRDRNSNFLCGIIDGFDGDYIKPFVKMRSKNQRDGFDTAVSIKKALGMI